MSDEGKGQSSIFYKHSLGEASLKGVMAFLTWEIPSN